MQEILKYFPNLIQIKIQEKIINKENQLEEVRLRTNKNIVLKFSYSETIVDYIVTSDDVIDCLQKICENSIYSYQNEIAEGFVTVKGGHRVGITGSCVIENGKVINIKYISSLNFRIARQIIGCGNEILNYIVDYEKNTVFNTLLVAPPCSRKNYHFTRYYKADIKWKTRFN